MVGRVAGYRSNMVEIDPMALVCLVISGVGLVALVHAIIRRQINNGALPNFTATDGYEEYEEPLPPSRPRPWIVLITMGVAFLATALAIAYTVVVSVAYRS